MGACAPWRGHHFAIFVGAQWGMLLFQSSSRCASTVGRSRRPRGALTEADAIDIWIARWLRIRRKDLLIRYGCDPRRLYEIWEEKRFAGSRDKALELFRERHPGLRRPDRLRTPPAHPARRPGRAAAGPVRGQGLSAGARLREKPVPVENFRRAKHQEQIRNFLSTLASNRGMFSLRSGR